jgi:hypothetical protein
MESRRGHRARVDLTKSLDGGRHGRAQGFALPVVVPTMILSQIGKLA